MYVHMNPYGGKLTVTPSNGTALVTKVNISTQGWNSDTSLIDPSVNIPSPSLFNMLVWSVGNGYYNDAMFNQLILAANNIPSVSKYFPTINALNASSCKTSSTTSLTQTSFYSDLRLTTPAWVLQAGLLGNRLGLSIENICNNWNLGVSHLLTTFITTNNTITTPRTTVSPAIVSFRVDVTGTLRSPNRTNMFSNPILAQRALLQLSNNAAWYGTPLAAASSTNFSLSTTLPLGTGAQNSLSLYTFYADGEGGLNWLETTANSNPALVGDAAKDPVAVTNYVTEVTKTITTASVQENPYGTLLAVTSLGGLLSNASSSSINTNTSISGGQNVTAEVRANNTALRTTLVSAVLTAVTSITSVATSTSNLPPTTNVSAEVKTALRTDTSIAVDDGTVSTAATALTSLTSDPTELSTTARTDALAAVQTLLTFSLPTNVLYGAVDEEDTISSGSNTTSTAVTAPVPVFPVAAATDMLGVMVNVISVDDLSSQVVGVEGTGELVDANAVTAGNISATRTTVSASTGANSTGDVIREKVNSVLRTLSAAVLRAAEPGDKPISIASGPSDAFTSTVTNARRLQSASGNSTLGGYCGPGLSITTARVSTQGDNTTDLRLENPMVPCFATGVVTPTNVANTVAPPKIKVNPGFLASGTTSRVVDIAMVQNGRSPVPETVGFRSMRFSTTFTGTSANLAEPDTTNTTTNTNGRRLSSSTSSSSGSIQSAIAAAGLSLASGNETKDLDPGTGLDSRVLSVNLQSRAGKKVDVREAAEPIYITIPLKDPNKGSGALQLQSAYRRVGYNITCPQNSVGAASGSAITTGMKIPALSYYLNSNGTMDNNSLVNISNAEVVGVSTLTYLAKDTSKKSYFGYTVGSAVKLTSASVYVLSVPCGDPIGNRNITCGPEFYGQSVTYECPEIGLLPLCAFWDEYLRRWSTAGCSVAKVTDTSVVCACNHLTEFAARFAALADEQRDIFARSADIFENPGDLLEKYPHVFIIIGIIFSLTVVSFLISWVLDKRAAVKFYETLLEDEEVQFLARIEELKGNVFILDRILDARKAAISDEIKAARLELEAKRIAEEHGLVYMRRTLHESELVRGNSLFSTIVQSNKSLRRKLSHHKTSDGSIILSDGSSASNTSSSSTSSNKDNAVIHIANPMLNTRKVTLSHINNDSGSPTPVSDHDDALEKIAQSSLIKKRKFLDPYTAALYLRVSEAFDSFKVRASSVKEEYRAGIISKDMAKQFGVEDDEETPHSPDIASPRHAAISLTDRGRALVQKTRDYLQSPHTPTMMRRDSHMDTELDDVAKKAAELELNNTSSDIAALKVSIVEKARRKIEKLEETNTWSIVRAWRLRNFIFRMWSLKVWFNHMYLSIFTKYDPRLSRTARTLLLSSALLCSMFCTAFFFAFRNGGPGQNLPPLELAEVVVVSILSALMQQPITMAINILINRAGTAEFTYRYPYISAEIQRRKDAEARLAKLSKKQLETELRSAADERKTESKSLRHALEGTGHHALGSTGSVGPASTSNHTSSDPATTLTTTTSSDGTVISTVIDMSEKERSEDFSYGWMDPPASCVTYCSCLLRICRRHPSQKQAYIKFMAAQEAKARAAREKKIADEKAKKKQRKLGKQKTSTSTEKSVSSDGTTTAVTMPNMASSVATNMIETKLEENALTNSTSTIPSSNMPVTDTPVTIMNDDIDSDDDEDDASNMLENKTGSTTTNAALMDDIAEKNGNYDGDNMGDCSVSCVTCLCGICGARRTVKKEMKKRRRSLHSVAEALRNNDEELSGGNHRRSVNWSSLFNGTSSQTEMAEAMEHSAKVVELDEVKRAANRRQNRLLYCCRLAPFTMITVVAYSFAWAAILFFLYYLFLFGLVQSKEVTLTFTYAFLSSQAMSAFIVQPGIMFATTLFTFAILPAWLPYVIWIPIIGPILAGRTAAALSSNDGSMTLTGRMENLTLVRAAGAASALTPDAAMVAYGVTAVMGAALAGVNQAAKQVLHGRDAALKGGNEPQSAFAAMTAAQRHELIVRRYLVAQLRLAEAARKEQLALARARALAFSVGQAAQAFKNAGLRHKLLSPGGASLSPDGKAIINPSITVVRNTPIGRGKSPGRTSLASIANQALLSEHKKQQQQQKVSTPGRIEDKHAPLDLEAPEQSFSSRLLVHKNSGSDQGERLGFSGLAKAAILAEKESKDNKEDKYEEK